MARQPNPEALKNIIALADKAAVDADARAKEVDLQADEGLRPKIVAALDGRAPLKVIHAGGKLVNVVVR